MTSTERTCSVEDCGAPVLAKGFCHRHYWRNHNTGDPGPVGLKRLPDHSPCSVEGCGEPNVANGYCEMHRWRVRKYGDPGEVGRRNKRRPRERKPCAVEGCGTTDYARGLCRLHYERQRRTGEVGPAGLMVGAKGNGTLTEDGYRRIRTPDGRRLLEHVYMMEQILGRRLLPRENVHHKNGRRADNRPENLELWVKPQPAGQRVADLVAFVVKYYPDEVRKALV